MKHLLNLIRKLPPETSHKVGLNGLKGLNKIGLLEKMFDFDSTQEQHKATLLNLDFKNRLGIAAGLDKNAEYVDELSKLGFGFVEVGTVTPRPQFGNKKPRVHRFQSQNAVINSLGFNNKGIDFMVNQIRDKKFDCILGVNIGPNKGSRGQQRIDDYSECFSKVIEHTDYVTINISSPNTPELRDLHEISELEKIFNEINRIKKDKQINIPVLLKISPDEDEKTLDLILDNIKSFDISGLIVSNTTIDKSVMKLNGLPDGGISGKPLFKKSNKTLKYISKFLNKQSQKQDNFVLIGVGGVFTKKDFDEKTENGADLVQLYTGFIYEGPAVARNILS